MGLEKETTPTPNSQDYDKLTDNPNNILLDQKTTSLREDPEHQRPKTTSVDLDQKDTKKPMTESKNDLVQELNPKVSRQSSTFSSTETHTNEPPYTILTDRERYMLSALLSAIGLVSCISMPIYWVALTEIQHDFNITEEQTNLTVTAYLVLQAISPMVFSNAGDYFGRRPVILTCLIGGVAVNVGLAVTDAYWLMIFLRCLLAMFVSPVISINMSVVGDFTTRRNRGGIASIVSGFTLIGQALAPFLGSVMDTAWNWRAIFWFSAAFDGLVFALVLFLLPETRRTIVGNLSVVPKNWLYYSPVLVFLKKRLVNDRSTLMPKTAGGFNPFASLWLLRNPEVPLSLLPCSLVFATWTIAMATLSTSFVQDYGYSTLKVGLCFFSSGGATIIGTLTSGKMLDKVYRKMKKNYIEKNEELTEEGTETPAIPFNILKARLGFYPVPALAVAGFTLMFGWCTSEHVNIAPIIIAMFVISLFTMFPMSSVNTLLVDLYPEMSGSAASLNNLFRCGMSAIFMSCLSKMNSSMTIGGTYSFMAGIDFVSISLILFLIHNSTSFLIKRQEKRLKQGLPV
ncbi:unnamed protein product [Ambrosiozyma monospora]|uniref:Unnamed protein product n=1 Tax=Ambrosiozyma monospora TaxID=43982 RepID=A0ACB5SW56_AMBMO|nr:unnamed protein product [Ambrosiozyma monospora]